MDCLDEAALLRQARSGGRAAFGRLQAALDPVVRRFARRLIGPSDAEDDIVREMFLALYMNLGRLETAERLRPFVFRVVRNLCYTELRRLRRFEVVSLDAAAPESAAAWLIDPCPPLDEQVQWGLLYSDVQAAMDRLPELQRQSLILYCEEDLSYEQIAEAMATDIGTVKSRIHYARRNLRRLLPPDTREALGLKSEEKE